MLRWIQLTGMFLALIVSGFARAETPEERIEQIQAFRRHTLAIHIDALVKEYESALLKCSAVSKDAIDPYLKIQDLRAPYLHSQDANTGKIFSLMRAYQLAYRLKHSPHPCARFIRDADQNRYALERVRFEWAYRASAFVRIPAAFPIAPSFLQIVLMQLDPQCALETGPNLDDHQVDLFPCIAGATLVTEALKSGASKRIPYFGPMAMFGENVIAKLIPLIQNGTQGGMIDLAQLSGLSDRTPDDRHRILALLAYLNYGYPSGAGAIDPTSDMLWKAPLQLGMGPDYAFDQYASWLNRTTWMRTLRVQARAKHIRLMIHGEDVTEWNNHEYIAAFLACHFKLPGDWIDNVIANTIPRALGYVYETKDFMTHRKMGVSWKESADNFVTDTERHNRGTRFGLSYCR